jgi:protease-4
MSEPNRMQLTQYLDGTWSQVAASVSADRNISADKLEMYANEFATINAPNCLSLGFVDALKYDDEIETLLRELSGKSETEKPTMITLSSYIKSTKSDWMSIGSDVIALVYAEGEIIDGEGTPEQIGGDRFVEAIRKARENKKVKAMVIRVNSPGGSAFASDLIWREISLAQEQMPVVVSMGNVAASGGYYIAAPADSILVNPFTVTGSIGVFGVFFTGEELIQNKMGLRYDGVKTHELAELGALYRDISPNELNLLENNVTATYGKFLNRVATGRGLDSLYVDSIGQGRIWLGSPAIERGLADGIGGLKDAIDAAKHLAGITEDYRVADYPEAVDPVQQILKQLDMDAQLEKRMEKTLGNSYKEIKKLENILNQQGVQARMEWDILE